MAHQKNHSIYDRLTKRLNRFPQGAPPSELLFKILKMLFTETEARLISQLPIKPFTAEKAARIWKMDLAEAKKRLNRLADKALLLDIAQNGKTHYVMPPPMAGFFEFSMMRTRNDIDQKLLAELYYQYINQEDAFIRDLFTQGTTQLGRVFVNEKPLDNRPGLHVLDHERASHIVKTARHMGVSLCYCRHKMSHVGKDCDAPKQICMTFNTTAGSLIRHGFARKVQIEEGLELLERARENNLVQFGENVREGVNFICNCCGCCCEAMIAARHFAFLHPVHTSNFLPVIDPDRCSGCGKCISICPVEAMVSVSANDPKNKKKKRARLVETLCLGCAVCHRVCPENAITLNARPRRVLTPVDSAHRTVIMAIERGTLQHLIFDNRLLWSHRAMAALLGAIFKLPPVQKTMANQQLQSRCLPILLEKFG